eukprot:12016306-Alexandrium_andersonii.AAC.1
MAASEWMAVYGRIRCYRLGSLRGNATDVRSTIRSQPVRAAICLNPQPAPPKMRMRFKCSDPEPSGP